VLELEDLFVDPDWMRRGIGLALVADAVATGRARGAARIEVTANPHALAFYGQAGFVPSGSIETRFGPAARMRLEITR
jgi:GNAT superfamily N-acetyltransferase